MSGATLARDDSRMLSALTGAQIVGCRRLTSRLPALAGRAPRAASASAPDGRGATVSDEKLRELEEADIKARNAHRR